MSRYTEQEQCEIDDARIFAAENDVNLDCLDCGGRGKITAADGTQSDCDICNHTVDAGPTLVCYETAYGRTTRLSFSIKVF